MKLGGGGVTAKLVGLGQVWIGLGIKIIGMAARPATQTQPKYKKLKLKIK